MTLIVASILIIVSITYYIWFSVYEGNDERGREIMAKASQISFIFILLGFVFQGFYFQFGSPSIENVETMIYVWMALVFFSNSISILLYQRKM